MKLWAGRKGHKEYRTLHKEIRQVKEKSRNEKSTEIERISITDKDNIHKKNN